MGVDTEACCWIPEKTKVGGFLTCTVLKNPGGSICSCPQLSSGLKVLKGDLGSNGLQVQPGGWVGGGVKEPINSEKYSQ